MRREKISCRAFRRQKNILPTRLLEILDDQKSPPPHPPSRVKWSASYLKNESFTRSRNWCQIQSGSPACAISSGYFNENFSVFGQIENLSMDKIALKTFTSNSGKLSW